MLLFPRFSNHCLANTVEPLRAANELLMRDHYRWRFVTLDGAGVVSSSGLPVTPQGALRDHPGGDTLFVQSSYDAATHATPATSKALMAAARRFKTVAGMDTGAWIMAYAGLLDGREATIHWDELTLFSEAFPQVDTVADRYVIDGDRITCGGAMTSFDLILELIRRTHGAALALDVSSFFLHQSTALPAPRLLRNTGHPLVEATVRRMSDHIETPLSIADLAKEAGCTQRALTRAFQRAFGAPPMTVYKRLRLATARRLAQQSNYSVVEIALRCGYRNAAAMTRAFVAEYGKPPSAFRR